MKNLKGIIGLCLVMFSSFVFAQTLSTGKMEVNWTADLVLGKGYTTTQTYTVDNINFVLCYNATTGKTQIWNLDQGGDPVYDKTTHTGWTSTVFFQLNNKTYLFTYKKASGEVIFFEMTATGISKRVGEHNWSKDWNGFDVLYRDGKPTIMMTRSSDGRAKLFEPHF